MGGQNYYVGEIHLFAGNFAPQNWAFCDGQLLPIANYGALYAILGTTYGGNGTTTFALPDLRGRAPVHRGQGPGLSNRTLGVPAGVENVTLTSGQLPAHNHSIGVATANGTTNNPSGQAWAPSPLSAKNYATPGNTGPLTTMAPSALAISGGNQPHNNMQPSLALSYIIALVGVTPTHP